jgi:tetratricopeptide (TPR) repeat protein
MGRLTSLHHNLVEAYSLEELRLLCASLDIPYEHLRGESLPDRALSLLQYADKRDRLPDLVAQCARERPNLAWQLPPPRQPGEPDEADEPTAGVSVTIGDVSGQVNIGGVADVRGNTGQVAVGGRNVIQIGSLNIPRWLAIALPILLVAGLAIAALGTARVFTISQPTPTAIVGPARMSGTFNVAVAQFPERDIDGVQTRTDDGDRISQWVFDNLQTELKDFAGAQVWHDSLPLAEKGAPIGIITGTTSEERLTTAKALADRIGAHMVIYGDLAKSGAAATFSPEFFVATAAISLKKEAEAEDVTGRQQLGAAIDLPLPFKAEAGLLVGDRLKSRAIFVRGVMHDLIGLHDKALEDFRSIQPMWMEELGQGKETLDFFLAREALFLNRNAALATSLFGSPEQALVEAENNFRASIDANPSFALGHWGLGSTLIKQVEPKIDAGEMVSETLPTLDEAIAHYDTALSGISASDSPLLSGKVRTSLANAYRLLGAARLLDGQLGDADAQFTKALQEVDAASRLIGATQPRATATTHWVRGTTLLNQGVLHKFEQEDEAKGQSLLEQAKEEFEACLNTFDNPDSRTVIDQTLKDYQRTNCQPSLDAAARLIELRPDQIPP